MARGVESKAIITKNILEKFEGSFLYNDGKEIRIPIQENGEEIQIKVTLTAAKENVYSGQDNATPGDNNNNSKKEDNIIKPTTNEENKNLINMFFPSEEEKANVKKLMETFGL